MSEGNLLDTDITNRHILHVVVNGQPTLAMIDTGADCSAISTQMATKIGATITQTTGTLNTAMGKTARIGCTEVTIQLPDGRELNERVELINLPSSFTHNEQAITICIGRDMQHRLGITLTTVGFNPSSTNNAEEFDEPELSQHHEYKEYLYGTQAADITEENRQQLLHSLQKVMKENQDLPPFPLCTAKGSTIHINTEPASTAYTRQYPVARIFYPHVTQTIHNWLEQGIIEEVKEQTSYNSAVLPVQKIKGAPISSADDIRLCNDFRKLNSTCTTGDHFTVPKIRDIMDKLPGAKYLSIMDIRWAFQSMNLDESDRHKTAFTWENRQYQHTRAPFGLTSVTSSFQRMISNVLKECAHFATPYIDDIIIHTHTDSAEDHAEHIKRVIETLTANRLQFNEKKSKLFLSAINILGHRVSREGIEMDPKKLTTLQTIQPPTTGKQISSFLGVCNYWRDWIPAYATVAAPLEKLRKSKRFTLNEDELSAFHRMKQSLLNNHVLAHPKFDKPFELGMDASNVGISAVLFQRDDHNTPIIVRFAARALTKTERNYSATKKELLALVYALTNFRNYILGYKFKAWTDHRALTFMLSQKKTNQLIEQWYETLSEYDFEIQHIQGVSNILPDALSRLFPDNKEHQQELDSFFKNTSDPSHVEHQDGQNSSVNILLLDSEVNISNTTQPIETQDLRNTAEMEQISDVDKQQEILSQAHNMAHFATKNMLQHIWGEGKHWPNLPKDAKTFYDNCKQCQRNNIKRQGFHPLQSITAELPMDHIAFDIAGPFSTTEEGFKYTFVVVDVATRFCFIRALKNKDARTIAKTLLNIFLDVGFPQIWQSDNAPEFVGEVMTAFARELTTQARMTTAYHPRANGLAEVHVKTITHAIRKKLNGAIRNWEPLLQFIQYAINTKSAALHGSTPFSLMFARKANRFDDYSIIHPITSTADMTTLPKHQHAILINEKLLARLQHMHEIVFPAIHDKITENNTKIRKYFDTKKGNVLIENIPEGTLVMTKHEILGSKLQPRLEGPFTISRRTQGGSYILLANGVALNRSYAPSQLKILNPHDIDDNTLPTSESIIDTTSSTQKGSTSQQPMNTVDITNNEDADYVFDKIMGHRESDKIPGAMEYWTKWTGYSKEHNSWVPEHDFNDYTDIVQYWKENKKSNQHTKHVGNEDLESRIPTNFDIDHDEESSLDGMSKSNAQRSTDQVTKKKNMTISERRNNTHNSIQERNKANKIQNVLQHPSKESVLDLDTHEHDDGKRKHKPNRKYI
jgi:hypothetical protein